MKNIIYQRIYGEIKQQIGTIIWNNNSQTTPVTRKIRGVTGLLVASRDVSTNKVAIGWSMLNPYDKFDLEIGQKIALGKQRNIKNVPKKIQGEYNRFVERAKKYFKEGIFE